METASLTVGEVPETPSVVTDVPRDEDPNNPNNPPDYGPPGIVTEHAPEPASLISALVGSGLAALGVSRARRARQQQEAVGEPEGDQRDRNADAVCC